MAKREPQDLMDAVEAMSEEEATERTLSAQAKLQQVRGFSDEKMSGYVAATEDVFETLGFMASQGFILQEQGLAFVSLLADRSMSRARDEAPSLH